MKRFLAAPAIASGLVLTLAVPALALGMLHPVTNGNNELFKGCHLGDGPGRNYVDSEAEPYGAVNPTNSNNVITVFQQDRWSNGGAHGLAAGVTTTGGSTWTIMPLPFSVCAAGTPSELAYERASDAWVSFGPGTPTNPKGATAYTVSISFNQSPGKNGNTVGAAVSYDGGLTWGHAQSLKSDSSTGVPVPVPDTNFQIFHDKESVTADPKIPGTAYVVWDVLIGPNMSVDADLHAASFEDVTLFSKTVDFGKNWSKVRAINNNVHKSTNQNNQTIGNIIVVEPTTVVNPNPNTRVLYNFFNQIFNTGSNAGGNPNGAHGFNVAFQKSTDGGNTWTSPQLIADLRSVGVFDPNNVDPRTNKAPAPIRTGDILPAPAIDPETGYLYVVWQDSRFSGHDEIVISTSRDGGATWSAPKRVSDPTGNPAFTATVAVSDSGAAGVAGQIAVTYYQFDKTVSGSEPTRYFIKEFKASDVMSTSLDTAIPAVKVAGPFNMLDAPFAGGYFVGDYEALLASGTGFDPVFVQGACGSDLKLSCSALTSVTVPADRTPTGNDSTNVFVGTGF
jgi:hypothetical protein